MPLGCHHCLGPDISLIRRENRQELLYDIQLNLLNSKSSGLEVLFQIIISSNYTCREVYIKIYSPHK